MSTVVWWKRKESIVADLETTIERLNEDLILERKINNSLTKDYLEIKRERDKLKDRNETLVKINEELTEKLEEALTHVDELKRTLYTRSHELAAARLANDDLKEKTSKLTDPALKHENEVLENTIIKLNREKMDLLERLDDRDGEIHDLKEKIIRLEQVIEGYNSRIRNAFDHTLELEKENAYYKRQVGHVRTAFDDLMTKLEAEKK